MKEKSNPTEINKSDVWNKDKIEKLKSHILSESQKQPKERILRNELLSIKYKMEDYVKNENVKEELRILDFVKLFLKTLKLSQKDLASALEMQDSNLHKYLKGDRKLNPELAIKLSSFFHTEPEIWYYIQTSNELRKLKQAKRKSREYRKYDFEKYVNL